MDFYTRTGKMALGSRLRRLSESMTEQAAGIYDLYQVDLQPKWFPVFYSLSPTEEKSITDIAREIGHTHPSVSQIVRELAAKGYIIEKKGEADGRKNFVLLSPAGLAIREKMQAQLDDVTMAIEKAMKETHHEEWITKYFRMEESDYKALDHPKEYILDKGGHIFMALYKGEAVGACAIIPMDDGGFELAKMAVSPRAQGLGIGFLIGQACVEKARALGARRVYLESNTTLKPAINLYHKLGFRKVAGPPSPYERCNIQMELVL
jgi:DNA-binding MarR family transcriptional regulator